MERFSDGTTGRDGRGPAFPKETDGIPHGTKRLPYNKIRENGTRPGRVIPPRFSRDRRAGRGKKEQAGPTRRRKAAWEYKNSSLDL